MLGGFLAEILGKEKFLNVHFHTLIKQNYKLTKGDKYNMLLGCLAFMQG